MKSIFLYCFLTIAALSLAQNPQVKEAIMNGRTFLKQIQKNNGSISDTLNPLFETWETVLAANALYDIDRDTNEVTFKKALDFLRTNENTSGLICHNRKCRELYCLETSAQYFSLLIKIGLKDKIIPRLEFIKELQKPGGEWEIGNPDVTESKDFPSVTAFVLQLFNQVGMKAKYEKEAYNWLIAKQTKAGDWGRTWEYYDCPLYALWPVMNIDSEVLLSSKKKATQFILDNKGPNGEWNFKTEKGPSIELQTALAIASLTNSIKSRSDGIRFILEHQQTNGSWNGGYFPIKSARYTKKEYVFATALCLMALVKS